jgi:hypothetical protein
MMEIVGSVGVAILLGAFFANLMGWLTTGRKRCPQPTGG